MGKLWCLIIKHNMKPLGDLFQVECDDNDSVTMLKKKVKEEMKPKLNNFTANLLTVWQYKDRNVDFDNDNKKIIKS